MSKFNYINILAEKKLSATRIPKSFRMNLFDPDFSFFEDDSVAYIMRSSLKGESSDKLRAGESLTIKNIKGLTNLKNAYEKINQQKNLEEIVVQEEHSYSTHITGLFFKGNIYCELKSNDEISHIMLTPYIQMGDFIGGDIVLESAMEICDCPFMLFEMGYSVQEKISLFQLMEVSEELVENVLSQSKYKEVYQNIKSADLNLNFSQILKLLFKSIYYRSFLSRFSESSSLIHWNFVLFYFALYLRLNKLNFSYQYIQSFLIWVQTQNHWIANSCLDHIKLVNKYSKTLDTSTQLRDSSVIYLGKGTVNKNFLFTRKLTVEEVLRQTSKPTTFMTQDKSILGHAYLQVIEKGHFIVGNLSEENYLKYSSSERISVDFNEKLIVIN